MSTVAGWEVEDVAAWLERSMRLPYAGVFAQANIDGPGLVQLDKDMLLDLGVDDADHITCLLDHISVLRCQWERALRNTDRADYAQVQGGKHQNQRLVTRASFRGVADDSGSGAVYPRVGSPLLCEGPRNQHTTNNLRWSENGDAAGKDVAHDSSNIESDAGHVDTDHHHVGSGAKEMGPAEFGLAPVASQSSAVSGGISTTCSTAAGSGIDALPQGQRLATYDPKQQRSRHAPAPLPNKLCPVRAQSEALSRSSSAPSSRGKRGPSLAAADGASLFLSDQTRGVHFGTTPRDVEVLPQSLGPGPARYDAGTAACKTSAKVTFGIPKFNVEPRKTMEGMYMRGWAGPGVGKYNPPLRSRSRGGSFTRASRWGSRSAGGLPGTLPSQSPGPMSYKPNHAALSTVH